MELCISSSEINRYRNIDGTDERDNRMHKSGKSRKVLKSKEVKKQKITGINHKDKTRSVETTKKDLKTGKNNHFYQVLM